MLTMDSELGQEVAVADIDKELRKLWEADDAHTNASLINLVTCSEESGSLRKNSAIIQELTEQHACRAILVEFDRKVTEPSIRAWITAHCHLSGEGKKSVCCEQIAFLFTGRVTGRFRNTVFAHLSSDLPLIFWWQGELTNVFTERLSSVIDRLVIDSAPWKDPAASFQRLRDAVKASGGNLVVQDLAWTRTWQFRLSVAALFDQPAAQQALPEITAGKIVHHPAHRSSALQLLAWLAVQAGWKTGLELAAPRAKAGADSFGFESAGGTGIHFTLEADPAAPALALLELKAPQGTIRISRKKEASHLTREVALGGTSHTSIAPADPDDDARLVGDQLSRGGKNSLYRKVVPKFLELLGS